LADDHQNFLPLVTRLLGREFEVVKTVGDGLALLEETGRLKPDILVLDISMPVLNGIEAARQLKAAGCDARIIFLTMHLDADYVRGALEAGGQGYVIKSRLALDLPLALGEALAGKTFISPSISLARKG